MRAFVRAPAAKVEKNTVTDSLYTVENWGPLDPKRFSLIILKKLLDYYSCHVTCALRTDWRRIT